MYRIQEFARLAGVTVRALHHYDKLGLLTPKLRSESGYRLYQNEDLGRLERVLVLRLLGLSLREIKELLESGGEHAHASLTETLLRQASVLRERRNDLDRVLKAVNHALAQASPNAKSSEMQIPDWQLYQSILKEMKMQNNQSWTEKYYTPEAVEVVESQRTQWNPELQAKITADWQQMYADVQSALDRGIAPRSAEGKNLAERWMRLVGQFTGGNQKVLEGLNKLYEDRAHWPQDAMDAKEQANLPKPEHMTFIRAAQSAD